jgi:hypothetical protein
LFYIGSHQLYLEFFFLHLHVSPPLLLIVLILVKCVIPRRDWKCHSDEGNEEDSEGDTSVKGRTSKGQNNFLTAVQLPYHDFLVPEWSVQVASVSMITKSNWTSLTPKP